MKRKGQSFECHVSGHVVTSGYIDEVRLAGETRQNVAALTAINNDSGIDTPTADALADAANE